MTDRSLVLVAGVTAAAALWGYPVPAAVVGVCVVAASAAVRFQPSRASGAPWTVVFLVALALASATSHRAFVATSALDDALPRTVRGVATLRTDPEPTLGGARAIIEIQHRRYLATFTQPVASIVGDLLAGERVQLVAQPRRLRHVSVDWQRSQHLAGRVATGTAVIGPAPSLLARCANGVRRRLVAGADPLPEDLRPLYLGLVVGDDRSQAPVLRHQFRASGLAHLLAVSGQNVAFVLLAAAPLLGRLRLVPRAIATMLLLALFTMVVRAEASVLRAVAMAFVVVVAALLGRRVSPLRGALLAAVALLVADPLLIRSVGFRLSVAATVGLVVLTRPIARHVPGPRPFATAVSVVLAAQVATSPVLVPLADG
ncbi:MAG: ComEC/Rec2 family competence protein, partial [Actinomycetes bacterium]